MTPSSRLREDPCSRNLSVVREDPVVRRHRARWAMCFVVVGNYDGICHGLRDQIILIIFDSEYDPEKESAMSYIKSRAVCTH